MLTFIYKTGFKNSLDGTNFKPPRKNSKTAKQNAGLCSHTTDEAKSMYSYGTTSPEEQELFRQLVARNARNMSFKTYKILFPAEEALEELVQSEVAKWEAS